MSHTLTPNTQAILLLTAPLLSGRGTPSQDLLKPSEYRRLAIHLRDITRQPSDLLGGDASSLVQECSGLIDQARMHRLLERGFQLSLAVDRWQSRNIWVISRADAGYPRRLKGRLREDAPAVLYGCGQYSILETGGLAVVGSRDADPERLDFARQVGRLAAESGVALVSGGARGIDQAAMNGALGDGGRAIGVLADSLERAALAREHRDLLMDERLVLVSAYDPSAGFNVGHAMERNKFIYALADAALVVSSDYKKGGTWAGACEQLDKFHFVPVYIRPPRNGEKGLEALRDKGAVLWPEGINAPRLSGLLTEPPVSRVQDSGAEGFVFVEETVSGLQEVRPTTFSSILPQVADISHQTSAKEVLFQTVRDLANGMPKPIDEASFGEALGIMKVQAKAWYKQLIEEGVLKPSEMSSVPINDPLDRTEPSVPTKPKKPRKGKKAGKSSESNTDQPPLLEDLS
jgi:predicted Rossmann fold nucleotide-binding protein DprA/Smf involved in DNA uptake